MFTRFDRIHERDGQTHRKIPRDGIGRAYIYIASCGKNKHAHDQKKYLASYRQDDVIKDGHHKRCTPYSRTASQACCDCRVALYAVQLAWSCTVTDVTIRLDRRRYNNNLYQFAGLLALLQK